MTKLNVMKSIKSINRVAHKQYEILYEDDTKTIVTPQGLPTIKNILKKSPVLYTDLGLDCPVCSSPMRQFYRYRWYTKVNPNTGKVLRYNRNKFIEEIIINICLSCNVSKYAWEDGTELVCEKPLKNSALGKTIRLEKATENPRNCKGCRKFAMGHRIGELICTHRSICSEAGCAPEWVFFINDSCVILIDDIMDGELYIYNYMDLPFLEPVQC